MQEMLSGAVARELLVDSVPASPFEAPAITTPRLPVRYTLCTYMPCLTGVCAM
jgi:hypothetical protein